MTKSKNLNPNMNQVHFFFGAKGGSGKSVCWQLLSEYLKQTNEKVICCDTDVENTKGGKNLVAGLDTIFINVKGKYLNKVQATNATDKLYDSIADNPATWTVNTGTSNWSIMKEWAFTERNLNELQEDGFIPVVNIPIIASKNYKISVENAEEVIQRCQNENIPLLLWITEHEDTLDNYLGCSLYDTNFYKKYKGQFKSIVKVPYPTTDGRYVAREDYFLSADTYQLIASSENENPWKPRKIRKLTAWKEVVDQNIAKGLEALND